MIGIGTPSDSSSNVVSYPLCSILSLSALTFCQDAARRVKEGGQELKTAIRARPNESSMLFDFFRIGPHGLILTDVRLGINELRIVRPFEASSAGIQNCFA